MSRSIGDSIAAQAGVIHKPDVKHFYLKETDKALVLATDGVWEFLSNKTVTKLLIDSIKKKDPKSAAKKIVDESVRLWKAKDSVIDDITVIVALFNSKFYN